jgi:hypothetical protein
VTNAKTRESRLFKNTAQHMAKSATAIMRSYLMFRPYVIFATLAVTFGVLAVIPFGRFLVLWFSRGGSAGNVQSLIFGSVMSVAARLSLALGTTNPGPMSTGAGLSSRAPVWSVGRQSMTDVLEKSGSVVRDERQSTR